MNIRLLTGGAGLRRFVAAPWKILDAKAFPQWVPPLRMSVQTLLDPEKNPFFTNAGRALFLAESGGHVVGRVAAIHNGWAADAGTDAGHMGFFECADDAHVAAALLGAAEDWLKARGHTKVIGPLNPSTNYDGGVLIRGFEHTQTFLTPWNPPYYPDLITGAGYEKAADLLGWHRSMTAFRSEDIDRIARLAAGASRKLDLAWGPLDFSDFDAEMRGCWKVYCACWERQWGFVPLGPDEWRFMTREMKPLMIREGTLVVRAKGEIVGFVLVFPDYSRALTPDRSGRLLPLNWLRLLRARRHAPWVRIMAAGVLPSYRKWGLLPLLLNEAAGKAAVFGVSDVEASWIHEDNDDLNLVFDRMGAEPYRAWRIYQKQI